MSKAFTTHVRKWGSSKAVIIPPQIIAALGLNAGDVMAARKHGDQIILEPIRLQELARKHSAPAEVPSA